MGHASPRSRGSKSVDPTDLYMPGFVHVELMLKDAQRYMNTDGWGWGRWRGEDLKPYGSDVRFVNEYTSCHMPVGSDDYVYTLPITLAHVPGEKVANNQAVAHASVLCNNTLLGSLCATVVQPAILSLMF
jgi:hypothetical protein